MPIYQESVLKEVPEPDWMHIALQVLQSAVLKAGIQRFMHIPEAGLM